MKQYSYDIIEQKGGTWAVEIRCNSDVLVCYGDISTQDDAYLVAEAFIDGIELVEVKS